MPSASSNSSSVLVIQLTDSHLFAEPERDLLGMPTRASLEAVVDQVVAEHSGIDLVLATGDLSQDGSIESYQAFQTVSNRLDAPKRWLPGNHDAVPAMAVAAGQTDCLNAVTDIGNWRITTLNSAVPGAVHGYLDDSQLHVLAEALSEAPERHHLICLHHHPVPIGAAWMAPIGLRNPEAFFSVLDRFTGVRAVLWGHVHQVFDEVRKGVRLMASPSTCIQFAPNSEDFSLDSAAPGYRWLRLHDDGRLETGVSRIAPELFKVDPNGSGY